MVQVTIKRGTGPKDRNSAEYRVAPELADLELQAETLLEEGSGVFALVLDGEPITNAGTPQRLGALMDAGVQHVVLWLVPLLQGVYPPGSPASTLLRGGQPQLCSESSTLCSTDGGARQEQSAASKLSEVSMEFSPSALSNSKDSCSQTLLPKATGFGSGRGKELPQSALSHDKENFPETPRVRGSPSQDRNASLSDMSTTLRSPTSLYSQASLRAGFYSPVSLWNSTCSGFDTKGSVTSCCLESDPTPTNRSSDMDNSPQLAIRPFQEIDQTAQDPSTPRRSSASVKDAIIEAWAAQKVDTVQDGNEAGSLPIFPVVSHLPTARRASTPEGGGSGSGSASTPEGVGNDECGLGSAEPKSTQTLTPLPVSNGKELLDNVHLPGKFSRRVFRRALEYIDRCQHTTLLILSYGRKAGGVSVMQPMHPEIAAVWQQEGLSIFDDLPNEALDHWSKAAVVVHPISGQISALTVPIDVRPDQDFDVTGGSRAIYGFSAARAYNCIAIHKKVADLGAASASAACISVFSSSDVRLPSPIFVQCHGSSGVVLDRQELRRTVCKGKKVGCEVFRQLPLAFFPGFDRDGAPVWHSNWNQDMALPKGCDEQVVNHTLKLASKVATQGLGEKQPAKGFLLIIGDANRLMSGFLGTLGKHNKYAHIPISVLSMDAGDMTFVKPDFGMDKAMIICGTTGRILANQFAVTDLAAGEGSQGAKHHAASAIAQKGFFAIKCSEDSCSVDGRAVGSFKIFPGTKESVEVRVKL